MPEEMKNKLEVYLVENVAKMLKHGIDEFKFDKYEQNESEIAHLLMYGLAVNCLIWSYGLERSEDIEEYARKRWECLKR